MEQIQKGIVLPGAIAFNDQNINPTWRANVKLDDGNFAVAFIKRISPRAIFIECICAIIGRSLGLPIPKPLVIAITHEAMSDVPEGNFEIGFGSEDAGYPSFRRFVSIPNIYDKLRNFAYTLNVAIFDEWIGNPDRNQGNILFDGGDKYYFIDHERAIGSGLLSHQAATHNQLANLYQSLTEFEKFKTKRDIQVNIEPVYNAIPYALLSEKTFATTYFSENEIIEIVTFLSNRTQYLSTLFGNRLGIQQRELAV